MTISVLGPSISSGVGDTDPAIAKQIAKYMNAGFKDAKADKFKLISAFVELEYISNQCSKIVNNVLRAPKQRNIGILTLKWTRAATG